MKGFFDNLLTLIGIFASAYFNKLSYLSPKKIEKYQKKLIKKQIDYCLKHIEFYKNLNIKIKNNPIDTLKEFPVISKEDIISTGF